MSTNIEEPSRNSSRNVHIMECTSQLTEAEMAERGALLASVLKLRKDREHPDRWQTTWGTKTNLGLFRAVERMIIDGE